METIQVPRTVFRMASAALAPGMVFLLATTLPVRTVRALPIYAQETRLPCGRCHVNPRGGGPRTAFGRAFAANGHRLPGGQAHGYSSAPSYGYPGGTMGGGGLMNGGMMGHPWTNQ